MGVVFRVGMIKDKYKWAEDYYFMKGIISYNFLFPPI